MKKYVYSVRRARRILLDAIRDEVESTGRGKTTGFVYIPHTALIARREAAIRGLIASVRAEKVK